MNLNEIKGDLENKMVKISNFKLCDRDNMPNVLCVKCYIIVNASPDSRIIDILSSPELNFLLGAVKTIINQMRKKELFTTNKLIESSNVEREITGSAGESYKILLTRMNGFQASSNVQCQKYIKVLRVFRNVVHDCSATIVSIKKFENVQRIRS